MDIVLEVSDTFLFDYMYAWALPAREAPLGYPDHYATNATQKLTSWQYKPATSWFSLEPRAAAYGSALARDNVFRQFFSFFLIFWLFGLIMYYVFASLNYLIVFDKRTFKHPKYLKNQIALEMKQANWSMPIMAIFTAPLCVLEVKGYSKLYDTTAEGPGRWWDYAQFPAFVFFTDMCIYFIHRGLHHPAVYKYIHKPHHKWVVPTPYASHAFHPIDGYLQGLPYHLFPFIFPLQKMAYVFAFVFINFWTIMIHDGEYVANNPVINGAACHSIHHTAFNYNYGQFTTLWDRLGGSYRAPTPELFQKEEKAIKKVWQEQSKTYQQMVAEVEGEDERVFNDTVETKKTL